MDEIAPVDEKLLALIKGIANKDMPMPYAREIRILDTYIAGTSYYKAKEIKDKLQEGTHLIFQREATNKYDKRAIAIYDLEKNKLGYIPQVKNEVISSLMDAGKTIYGVIDTKKDIDDFLEFKISVYMREY
jgi:hypothetical protein